MPRSRRSLLKASASLFGSGAVALTAGCLGGSPAREATRTTETTPGDSTDAPSMGTDSGASHRSRPFTQWLPDPATTPFPDGYGVRYFDVAGIRNLEDAIHPNAYDRLQRQMSWPIPRYISSHSVDATLHMDYLLSLAFGSFDPDAIGEKITSRDTASSTSTNTPRTATRTPWPEPERYGGFDLYGQDRVYAVSEDVVASVSPMYEGDAVDYAKAAIDAPSDETGQYTDSNSYVESMVGVVDRPHALRCFPEAMDGSTSRGFRADDITGQLKAWRFGSETTTLTFANTYVDAATAESGELREFIDEESGRFGPYEGLDVSVSERLAWTDGTIPTAQFDHLSSGGPGDGVTTPN